MSLISNAVKSGFTLFKGKNYTLCEKLMPKTGTKVYKVYDRLGSLVNKTVIPGAKNKTSHACSYSTNFCQGKPVQTLARRGTFGVTHENYAIPKKGYDTVAVPFHWENKSAPIMHTTTQSGTEVLKIKDDGELLTKVVFPSTTGSRKYTTSIPTNYLQGKPIHSAVNQGEYTMTFARTHKPDNILKCTPLERSDFFRPGDLS